MVAKNLSVNYCYHFFVGDEFFEFYNSYKFYKFYKSYKSYFVFCILYFVLCILYLFGKFTKIFAEKQIIEKRDSSRAPLF